MSLPTSHSNLYDFIFSVNTCKLQWMRTGDVKQQHNKKDTIKVVHTTHALFPKSSEVIQQFCVWNRLKFKTLFNESHGICPNSPCYIHVQFVNDFFDEMLTDLKLVYIILFTNLTNLVTAIHNFRKLPVNLRRKQIKLNIVRLQETWAIYNLKIHLYNI